ncbi:MAG: spondin domain-containing protein [Gammaproteobacteria bacterium]|nr:spondin domain-containing protein [Gammaproteobacteria bacterium]
MKNLIALITLSFIFISSASASGVRQYQVTITNATTHHVFTPALIVTHRADTALFEVGSVASDGLIHQAENGDPSLLQAEINSGSGVYDSQIGSFIPYGQSASFIITAPRKAHLSLTAMLATTNDGFMALNNVALPKRSVNYYAQVYDAGSEANNEGCSFIPGPPCAEGSGNARDTANSEGFISIHNGIHGHGELDPAMLDWRGPVAIINIRRID